MSDDTDDGYVYTPEGDHGVKPENRAREFGLRGWILVGWLVVSLIIVPGLLLYIPEAGSFAKSLGLGYRDAFLVLPLIPALGLGVLSIWATTRP